MHDVAPSAVRIALAIDTMICAINLAVSFFVITHLLSLIPVRGMIGVRIDHRRRIVVVVIVATATGA